MPEKEYGSQNWFFKTCGRAKRPNHYFFNLPQSQTYCLIPQNQDASNKFIGKRRNSGEIERGEEILSHILKSPRRIWL
jgi:hypothetical protein